MNVIRCCFLFLLIIGGTSLKNPPRPFDDFCGIRNTSFNGNEQLNFIVYYNVAGVYVNAGNASFTSNLEKLSGKTVYHVTGEGKTNPSYDWIYKVRDLYESFIDTASLQPLKFIRNVNEGGYKKFQTVTFNHSENTAITNKGVFKVPNCVQDVLSAIYYARNINFYRYKPGFMIPFIMFLDDKVFNMYVRYLGKEEVKTKYGKLNAIKFKPLLIEGTTFAGGEKM